MEQLLREGAYAVLLDDDEEVKEFFQQVCCYISYSLLFLLF
jgi:hypothetical protein